MKRFFYLELTGPTPSLRGPTSHSSYPFFGSSSLHVGRKRLESSSRQLACRTNSHYGLGGDLDRGNCPYLVRFRFTIQFLDCLTSRPPIHTSWTSLPEPLLASSEKAFRTTEIG